MSFSQGRKRGYRETPRRRAGGDRGAEVIAAPGGLELVQSFLNTLRLKPKSDELATPDGLSDWLSRNGLLAAGTRLEEADAGRARVVRSGLRALAAANAGAGLDPEAVARLDRAGAGARAQVRFERDGTSRFERISRDLDDALGTILGIVHQARGEGRWAGLKLCAHPECRRAFFDFTKSLNGRWCTRRCGDKLRARAWRRSLAARGLKPRS